VTLTILTDQQPVTKMYSPRLIRWDSAVDIATRYGLDGPGIESRWGGGARFSITAQAGPGAHPASYRMGTGSLSRERGGDSV